MEAPQARGEATGCLAAWASGEVLPGGSCLLRLKPRGRGQEGGRVLGEWLNVMGTSFCT